MAEEIANAGPEVEEAVVTEKIADEIHSRDLSSSDSDGEKHDSSSSKSSVKKKIYRLFGRERPVHKVLGGGKSADVLLWRDKKISASAVGAATAVWFLFEGIEYHILTFLCHILILFLILSFLWANAHNFVNKSPEGIPEISLPEKPFLLVASALTVELNGALTILRGIALGKDLKKFLKVIAGLWVISVIGKWFTLLTLSYLCFVLLHTVPVLYEKYEDEVDPIAERAMIEISKQYEVLDAKVLRKIPISSLKAKLG